MRSRWIKVGVASFIAFATQIHAIKAEAVERAQSRGSIPKIVYGAVDEAPLFPSSTKDVPPVWTAHWLDVLPVDSGRAANAPLGWVPIKGTSGKKARKGTEERPDAWIRREDLALGSDFHRVTGCWPVKSVLYVGGDYSAKVDFTTDGRAVITEAGDEKWINEKTPVQAHVYMSATVVELMVANNPKKSAIAIVYGYRASEHKLFPEGLPADAQEMFPQSELAGCSDQPTLSE